MGDYSTSLSLPDLITLNYIVSLQTPVADLVGQEASCSAEHFDN